MGQLALLFYSGNVLIRCWQGEISRQGEKAAQLLSRAQNAVQSAKYQSM
jgi:hypothetical protein